jgi:hypothetical protein
MSVLEIAPGPAQIPLPRLVDRLDPITAALDAAAHEERVAWLRGLGGKQLRALWELARAATLALKAEDFLHADGSVLIGKGKNGLPLFNKFEKRFARHGDQIVGYNHNKFNMIFVGPGHFLLYDAPDAANEVWIDYREIPRGQHPEFPPLKSNDRWIGPKLTYGGMVDKVRRVSRHIVVGDSFTGPEKHRGVPCFGLVLPAGPGRE